MNIYYSRSNGVDDTLLLPSIKALCANLPISDIKFSKHERGKTYDPADVENADLVIVGITNDYWTIGKGCYEEILIAKSLNIPILFLSLSEGDGEPFFCNCESDSFDLFSDFNEEDWKSYVTFSAKSVWREYYEDETLINYHNLNDDIDTSGDYTFLPDSEGDIDLYFECFILPRMHEKYDLKHVTNLLTNVKQDVSILEESFSNTLVIEEKPNDKSRLLLLC